MRRFALTTLRDFGMGKKLSEEKIMEECQYLIEVMEQYKGMCHISSVICCHFWYRKNNKSSLHVTGKAFDTTKSMNYAVSNIICAIMYGSRLEYYDPEFKAMVNRSNGNIQIFGSPSAQV